MAVVRPGSTAALALELGGAIAGSLRWLLPPSYRVERVTSSAGNQTLLRSGGPVAIGNLAAEVNLIENGPLLDWLMSLPRDVPPAKLGAGAVLLLDLNNNLRRRIDFGESLVTELSLPMLSATDGKKVFSVGVVWRPAQLKDAPGSGQKVVLGKPRTKALLCSNFRVQGLPFDGSFVMEVGLPTVRAKLGSGESRLPTRRYAAVDRGELTLRFAARSTDPVLAWVRKVLADGRLDDADYLDLTVELLDASLKTVLAVVSLKGCGLLACDEARLETLADTVGGISLRFSVEQVDLMFSGAVAGAATRKRA